MQIVRIALEILRKCNQIVMIKDKLNWFTDNKIVILFLICNIWVEYIK